MPAAQTNQVKDRHRTLGQLRADIAAIARELVQAFGLTHNGTVDDEVFYRWMDYRLRHVEVRARKVHKSNRFPVGGLPQKVVDAVALIAAKFEGGEDVNPYLSKTTIGNDVSSPKRQRRTDGLWADWGIHHFHLTVEPHIAPERFAARSDWLLFATVGRDDVAFVDVRSHGESDLWTQTDLVKTIIDTWPKYMEPYRFTEMAVDPREQSPRDHATLRSGGVNTPIEHKGQHYLPPGGGITMASTSYVATQQCLWIERQLRDLARTLDDPKSTFRSHLVRGGKRQPQWKLLAGPKGLVLKERSSRHSEFRFDQSLEPDGSFTNLQSALSHLLMPPWAAERLRAYRALRSRSTGDAQNQVDGKGDSAPAAQ